jgi:hypothetical protein
LSGAKGKWTDELIESELKKCISVLQVNRMPTADELKQIGRNDLHCKISKTKKYSGWASELGLEMKHCETRMGNQYEDLVKAKIEQCGFKVISMTTKHPYDLLVNNVLKIDVKVGRAHNHFEARAHTFALNKKYPTCDLYICVALNEKEEIERYFIIPSKFVQMVTLNIGKNSKYNEFVNRWGYIKRFINLHQRFIDEAR